MTGDGRGCCKILEEECRTLFFKLKSSAINILIDLKVLREQCFLDSPNMFDY